MTADAREVQADGAGRGGGMTEFGATKAEIIEAALEPKP
jgi:hypothetical protein